MCIEPTTALLISSAVSSGLQYQQAKAQQKAQFVAQKRQNELAKANALQRYASEQLKIRQIAKKTSEKGYLASIKSKKARASFIVGAGEGGVALSGSTQALMRDYYRVQGNYEASLQRNLNINISQFNKNMEAIQFGQQSQSTYVQPPNPTLLFASAVGNVANTYYSLEAEKQMRGLKTQKDKNEYSVEVPTSYDI
tara:strand:- start:1426 stop:2013 length:588 start_codon:yes stop_codon:yes gene_type:complete